MNEQFAEFPLASVALKVTVLFPTGKEEPEGKPAVCATETPGQLSEAVALANVATAEFVPATAQSVWLAGQVITGNSLSITVTVKLQLAALPAASVATTLTVVVPVANVLPEAGLMLNVTPGQLSVAVAL